MDDLKIRGWAIFEPPFLAFLRMGNMIFSQIKKLGVPFKNKSSKISTLIQHHVPHGKTESLFWGTHF
jgi:hypothetical protein